MGSPSGSTGPGGRDVFAADELAIVLSHYSLGPIRSVQSFARGSRRSPKLLLRTQSGRFLLKRRAKARSDPHRVAFTHELQLHLAEKQFPLPRLIAAAPDQNTMVQREGSLYELFEFIKGEAFDHSPESSRDAGKTLALFHKLVRDFRSDHAPASGSFHDAVSIRSPMRVLPEVLSRDSGKDPAEAQQLVDFLDKSYRQAADKVNALGMPDWPVQVVHADWHPGNMLFHHGRVVAVIDYDSARIQQPVTDVANGALQFSIEAIGEDPESWPAHLSVERYTAFLQGYDATPGATLSRAELTAIPWLMIEALIAEAVVPVAATGSFAHLKGRAFLNMIRTKVKWIQRQAEQLAQAVPSA